MFNGLFDIVFFALIAAFLAFRVYNVLGRREEGDSAPERLSKYLKGQGKAKEGLGNIIPLPLSNKAVGAVEEEEKPAFTNVPEQLLPILTAIHNADKAFTELRFLVGARAAFDIILSAFSKGDKTVLKPLVSKAVLQDFSKEIDAREQSGERTDITVVAVLSADIVDATFHKGIASVTVKFVSEQISVVRNKEEEIIAGNPSHIENIVDCWVFSRNVNAPTPNWELVATDN